MCGPETAMGMQIAGAGAGAVGSYYEAKGQKIALKAAAGIADTNARISEMSAQGELYKGQRDEQRLRLGTAKLKGSQRASMAANGIDLGSDTAVNVLTSTDTLGEIDANTIAANAARSAWGYRQQGTNYTNEAIMARASAKGINPFMSAGKSLMTSAASISQTRYKLKKEGVIPKDDWWSRNVESYF